MSPSASWRRAPHFFELRADLQGLRRGAKLEDIAAFWIALADFSRRLMRLMWAIHRVRFRGPKRAVARLKAAGIVPEVSLTSLEDLAQIELDSRGLPLCQQTRGSLADVTEHSASRGDVEMEAPGEDSTSGRMSLGSSYRRFRRPDRPNPLWPN